MIRSKDKRALRCSVAVPVWPVCGFSPSEQHPQLPGQHLPGPPPAEPPVPLRCMCGAAPAAPSGQQKGSSSGWKYRESVISLSIINCPRCYRRKRPSILIGARLA